MRTVQIWRAVVGSSAGERITEHFFEADGIADALRVADKLETEANPEKYAGKRVRPEFSEIGIAVEAKVN